MSRPLTQATVAAALLSIGMGFNAAAQKASPPAATADAKFMMSAAEDGMAEVELGKLAQSKAANDAVKQFGARMVTDHTKAGDELKGLASSKGVALPAGLDKKHQKQVDELSKSKRFDHEYMEAMVSDHKKAVSLFRKESKSGKDAQVSAWATKTLPTLEDHLKMAQDTRKAVK
jgi:putative membrane protein